MLLNYLVPKRGAYTSNILTGHNLDLYCVLLSNATPFCKNYTKLYFDAEPYKRDWIGGMKVLVPFFRKKVPFLANIKRCPKFLQYALLNTLIKNNTSWAITLFISLPSKIVPPPSSLVS